MKYMGSKSRFVKQLVPIVTANRKPGQWYVEPFAGGMNMICTVEGNRIANDSHFYLIEMWKAIVERGCGWIPDVDREMYKNVKTHPESYPAEIVGWVGFNCSYSGKWFGGYAGKTKTKIGTIRDYQQEALNAVIKQAPKMQGVVLSNVSYSELKIPDKSIVYCDPPYEGTTRYHGDFDHAQFWDWVRDISKEHTVFVSEYNAPDDFRCVWEKEAKSSLSANGKIGGNKNSVERLFTL